ncbi:hypothetical protein [Ureibacillus sp. FSL K6-3587]|jgi:hypothetical protein|uniref:hypothetical protein n=1 Tax=Ureibacillus sp. FSL K6-3587 TaxID=2954681 RepID=UPI003158B980
MKANNKAKWIVGITGVAFSAFVLGQINGTPVHSSATNPNDAALEIEINDSMSEREKELVKLDWSNFTLNQNQYQGADDYGYYKTRRS